MILINAQDKQTKEPHFEAGEIEIDGKTNKVTYGQCVFHG